jgi:hypothetical protein
VSERLDLQTLPRLFHLHRQPAAEITVTEALDRQARRDRAGAATASRRPAEGSIRSRHVGLLGPRHEARLHWLRHDRYWLLSVGGGALLALAPAGERWTVIRLDRDGHERLAADIDLGYAQGIAEDYVRASGTRRLADPRAAWRRAPMSPAQVGELHRLGVPVPLEATRGEASDLIALTQGTRRLDRLASRAA